MFGISNGKLCVDSTKPKYEAVGLGFCHFRQRLG